PFRQSAQRGVARRLSAPYNESQEEPKNGNGRRTGDPTGREGSGLAGGHADQGDRGGALPAGEQPDGRGDTGPSRASLPGTDQGSAGALPDAQGGNRRADRGASSVGS